MEGERDNFNRHANFIEEIKRTDNARRRRVVVPRPRLETGAKKNVISRNDFAFGNFNVTSDEDDSPDARGKIFRISKQQVGGKRSRRRRRRDFLITGSKYRRRCLVGFETRILFYNDATSEQYHAIYQYTIRYKSDPTLLSRGIGY